MELRPLVDEGDGSRDRPALTNTIALLAAALKEEAGIEDGRLAGAYKDEADGHSGCPWRSGIRREGFDAKNLRHPSYAEAALRILEAYQEHPPYVALDRFTLAPGKHVNAEQLARLVEAARADAGRCLAPPGARTAAAPPHPSPAGTRGGGCKRRDRTAHASGRIAPPWQGRRRWDGSARGGRCARRRTRRRGRCSRRCSRRRLRRPARDAAADAADSRGASACPCTWRFEYAQRGKCKPRAPVRARCCCRHCCRHRARCTRRRDTRKQ